jgi:formyltetrahydrofolate deformylase
VCPDKPGIVAAVSTFLFEREANILDSAQHTTDPYGGTFFMRMEFQFDQDDLDWDDFRSAFAAEIGRRFGMKWTLADAGVRKRIGILVSRRDHCLVDLLWRWRRDELGADIVHVVSNHPDAEPQARAYGVPYTHVPVEKDRKRDAEERILELLRGEVDVVVLARYMQILSADFLRGVGVPVINIHHSFLPAFVGADPYRRAAERGVKIIGATAHYVTEELDAGPIIEQDVARVSHRDDLRELERVGSDIERVVLSRATRWHVEDRVIAHDNRTFVFA